MDVVLQYYLLNHVSYSSSEILKYCRKRKRVKSSTRRIFKKKYISTAKWTCSYITSENGNSENKTDKSIPSNIFTESEKSLNVSTEGIINADTTTANASEEIFNTWNNGNICEGEAPINKIDSQFYDDKVNIESVTNKASSTDDENVTTEFINIMKNPTATNKHLCEAKDSDDSDVMKVENTNSVDTNCKKKFRKSKKNKKSRMHNQFPNEIFKNDGKFEYELGIQGSFNFSFQDERVCVMSLSSEQRVLVCGVGHVTCLLGSVAIMGYRMKQYEKRAVFAPSTEAPLLIEGSHVTASPCNGELFLPCFDLDEYDPEEEIQLPVFDQVISNIVTAEFKNKLQRMFGLDEHYFQNALWNKLNIKLVSADFLFFVKACEMFKFIVNYYYAFIHRNSKINFK